MQSKTFARVFLGVGLLFLFGHLFLDRIVKTGIESMGTRALKVPVTVDSVVFSPLAGICSIEGLRIHNLPGYKERYLIEIGGIRAVWDLRSLWKAPIRVRSLTIHELLVNWEGTIRSNNLTQLQSGFEKGEGSGREVVLGTFKLDGVKARVHTPRTSPEGMLIEMSPMEFSNFSSRNPSVLVARIATEVAAEVVKHSLENGTLLQGLKRLFGR